MRRKVIDALRTCYDPEIPVNIYDLGMIYRIDIDEQDQVQFVMTLTSPACPVAGSLPPDAERKVAGVEGVKSAKHELVWEPPWNPDLMHEAAKLTLGYFED
jgi:FeS assembly SUF system protein